MKSFVEYNIKKKEISLVFTVDGVLSIISTTKSWPIRKLHILQARVRVTHILYK